MGILDKGIDLLRTGKNEEAAWYFLKMSDVEPKNDGVLRFLGKSYALLGQKVEATIAIEKAIAINPEQPMWLYKLLAENKLEYVYIDNARGLMPEKVFDILSNPNSIEIALGLDYPEAPVSTRGDGILGNKIICKAAIERKITFISPYSGKIVSTDYSLTHDAYYFQDDNFILSFFSDWANPFLFYQVYLLSSNTVIYGYLDTQSELHNYNKKPDSFMMYFANLLKLNTVYKSQIKKYLNSPISNVVISNRNFKHLGHAIWNGLSAINPNLYKAFLNSEKPIYFDPQSSVLPNYKSGIMGFDSHLTQPINSEEVLYNKNIFNLSIKANSVHESTASQILKGAYYDLDADVIDEIKSFRRNFFPVVIIGLRCGTRAWEKQEEGYNEVIESILNNHPTAGFIIDGMNSIKTEVHSSHANIDMDEEVNIANKLRMDRSNVISLIGESVNHSLVWGEIADCFVSPWGAGLAKYKWVNNIKGVVFSSRCVLEEKNDLHIYDDDRYRELAVKDIWLPAVFATNAEYKSIEDYKKVHPNGNGFYYQNFNVDSNKLSEVVLSYLNNISKCSEELKYKSFKVLSYLEEGK
jgi:hypothetical protein